MALQWLLNCAIICSMLYFIDVNTETRIEIKQNNKYSEEFNPIEIDEDEKAYKKMNERIKEVRRQENGKGMYVPPKDDSPRRYFYQKYLKIGKSKDVPLDYDHSRGNSYPFQNNNFNDMIAEKPSDSRESKKQYNALPTISVDVVNDLNTVKYSLGGIKALQIPVTISAKIINEDGNKDIPSKEMFLLNNLTNLVHYPENISEKSNNDLYYKKVLDNNDGFGALNNKGEHFNPMKTNAKQSEKHFVMEESNKFFKNNEINENNYVKNQNLEKYGYGNKGVLEMRNRQQIPLQENPYGTKKIQLMKLVKDTNIKKRNNEKENEDGEEEERGTNIFNEHRKARSCELKMEDIRESFMPNEELSIYHPKMSMTDQFVLSDTMF